MLCVGTGMLGGEGGGLWTQETDTWDQDPGAGLLHCCFEQQQMFLYSLWSSGDYTEALEQPTILLTLRRGARLPAPDRTVVKMGKQPLPCSGPILRFCQFARMLYFVSHNMSADIGTHSIRAVWKPLSWSPGSHQGVVPPTAVKIPK